MLFSDITLLIFYVILYTNIASYLFLYLNMIIAGLYYILKLIK
jgi:hypothetical protein